MKRFRARYVVPAFCASCCLAVLVGCTKTHGNNAPKHFADDLKAESDFADATQKQGIMARADMIRLERIEDQRLKQRPSKRTLSDSDMNWAIANMRHTSSNTDEVQVLMMSIFMDSHALTPFQRQSIRLAVLPLLTIQSRADTPMAYHTATLLVAKLNRLK